MQLFSKKSHKYLIVFLTAILLAFLFCGNYNLVETMTPGENVNSLENDEETGQSLNRTLGVVANNVHEDIPAEPIQSNYSTLGVKGNESNESFHNAQDKLHELIAKNTNTFS